MSNTSHSKTFNALALLASALIVASAVWVLANKQLVLDTFTNWSYAPSLEAKGIVDRAEFTDKGQFTFYATRPEVLEHDSFNKECPRQEAASPILGCYTPQDRIFIFKVTQEKLDGIKEVTAAHELLHAIWHRTNDAEKTRLSVLLRAAYQNASEELKNRMEYYERTEPGEFVNELHAILGTEMQNLGSELEDYYSQYFSREAVLALHAQYNAIYTELTLKAKALADEMGALAADIDATTKTYNEAAQKYTSDVSSFNTRAASGGFSTTAQFRDERAALVNRSNQLESTRQAINAKIESYNKYYADYQAINNQLQTLNNSIDSYHMIEAAPSV